MVPTQTNRGIVQPGKAGAGRLSFCRISITVQQDSHSVDDESSHRECLCMNECGCVLVIFHCKPMTALVLPMVHLYTVNPGFENIYTM